MAIGTTTAAIIGTSVAVASAVASAAASGSQAAKSKGAQRAAEAQAKRKLDEAKKEIQIMPMQELALDLQGYRAEQEASQVAAAQSIQAAQQGDGRGLAAAVGRTQMADIAQQRGARLDKASELQKLEMLKAQERQDASDKLASLSLSEAQGAQEAAAQEEMMAQQYTQQAIGSGVEAVKGAANLYSAVQGPYDPTGVKGASAGGVKNLTSRGDIVDFQDYVLSDPTILPTEVTLPEGFGNLTAEQLESQFFGQFSKGGDIKSFLGAYDHIYR